MNTAFVNPHLEISKYGCRRLRNIARFLRNNANETYRMFGSRGWRIDYNFSTPKNVLVDRISNCGAFQHMAQEFNYLWVLILLEICTEKQSLMEMCYLFGMEHDARKLITNPSDEECQRNILRKIINKLSTVYTFPGDPLHPISKKRMNDLRLNSIFQKGILGRETFQVAQTINSFRDTIIDPSLRTIFWSNYVPGTGQFNLSLSNLDQLCEVDDCCSICMDEFSEEARGIRIRPCGHIFHPSCLQGFIIRIHDPEIKCPMCRGEVNDIG
jgi:hypothetical protein